MKILRKMALAAIMAVPAAGASAAVIDFSDAYIGNHTNYVEDGYTFDRIRVVRGYCGTDPVKLCGTESKFGDSTMTQVGGGNFNLNGLWFKFLDAATPLKLVTDHGEMVWSVGSLLNGSAIETGKGYAVSLTDNALFRNISFLKFVNTEYGTEGNGVGRADLRIDKLDVAPVPLPAAGVLLLAGLGGFAAIRRRKHA